ncbi:hypothetical protein CVT24_000885 [Panaeolus cyanescens]|uniref:Reverse transcriptase zinc-binding domain-containing protein n=1 Tax=Panaeolus cyanescens TaxID=181874 RepID=A0A409YY32_9AGAR|nr:hypothetical protein CVT24_000885 [Panaeolus cyanescens]
MDLPRLLRTPLPRSISALRQDLKREAKSRANNIITASPRWDWFKEFETDYGFHNYHKTVEKLDRHKASLLVKIRTKHIPLNDYLYKRKVIQTNVCQQCQRGARESLSHFLFDCTKYDRIRNEMWTKIGNRTDTLEVLLSSQEKTSAMIEYVDKTGRFPRRRNTLQHRDEAT